MAEGITTNNGQAPPIRFGRVVLLLLLALFPLGTVAQDDDQQEAPLEAGEPVADQVLKRQLDHPEVRELEASEDPEQIEDEKREIQRKDNVLPTPPLRELEVYASARVRYRTQSDIADWEDGGSRAGAKLNWEVVDGTFFHARAELGFNLQTGFENLTSPGEVSDDFEDTVFKRLLYLGMDTPYGAALIGKNWSPYYTVAEYTDRFVDTGGSASGAFNAGTDGGPTGTGRADQALQTHFSIDFLPGRFFKPFELDMQVQNHNVIPFGDGARYGVALGLSAEVTTINDFRFGLAYNRAEIDSDDLPDLGDIGITGDAEALLFGTRAFGELWYAGVNFSYLKNHMTTDQGNYFDAWGLELYGNYQLRDRVWFVAGGNILEPDESPFTGEYRVLYGVVGIRYTFRGFDRMVYANYKLDDSRNADGSRGANVLTVGLRWEFGRHWSQHQIEPD